MFFHTFLLQPKLQVVLSRGDSCYMVTQCANQLVLAAECADPHIRRWLKTNWHCGLPRRLSPTQLFTEHTYTALQHGLQCASNATQAHICF
jgi:hypothetical protein